MKKFAMRIAVVMAMILAVTIIMPIAACKKGQDGSTIKIVSLGGIPLTDVTVSVKKNGNDFMKGVTNENGEFSVKFDDGKYTAEIVEGLPAGYTAEESYNLDTSKQVNTLGVKSSVITDQTIPSNKRYLVGDIMYDFTYERTYSYSYENGRQPREFKLSDVLEEKKAVMINFYFTTCSWCQKEYPSMSQAYTEYSDDLAIIGIAAPSQGDTETLVVNAAIKEKVPYDVALDTLPGVTNRFNVTGFPTSVMIDRYGVVCEFIGTTLEIEVWRNLFAKYTAEDYSQNINVGNDVDDETTFTPDLPADFDVHMPESSAIDAKINNTGVPIDFSTDAAETAWPWDFDGDGQSISPTNTGHRGTTAIIYASLNMPANTVLAFDYMISSSVDEDYFYVAVDGRSGIGKQTMRETGNVAWTTGYAYVSLEAGVHEIAFIFYRGSVNGSGEDKARVKNLRFENVSVLANQSLDVPYFAARESNPVTLGFELYADVYLDNSDGFYHVRGHANGGVDPILFADIQHATPYFTSPRESIYNKYIAENKCHWGYDYYSLMSSYNIFASTSELSGLVPVTQELQRALNALYNFENSADQSHYSTKGWLEFCVFYKHYGVGESIGNPVEGLTYFSPFEAHETTGSTSNLNHVVVDRLIMPRGFIYKFVPSKSGAYLISGVSKEGTDGWLFDDSLNVAASLANPINSSGYDDFERDPVGTIYDPDDENVANYDFKMYNYLEANRTYYIETAFHVVEEIGEYDFRIDYIGESHKYLSTVTAGFYTINEAGKIVLPVYADVDYSSARDVFYDTNTGDPIYCDFTSTSRMFSVYSIETILKGTSNAFKTYFNLTGTSIVIDGTTYHGKDYTEILKGYLEKAKQNTGELYGMVEVDWELQVFLKLLYQKYVGYDDENEWLKACWYYVPVTAPQS